MPVKRKLSQGAAPAKKRVAPKKGVASKGGKKVLAGKGAAVSKGKKKEPETGYLPEVQDSDSEPSEAQAFGYLPEVQDSDSEAAGSEEAAQPAYLPEVQDSDSEEDAATRNGKPKVEAEEEVDDRFSCVKDSRFVDFNILKKLQAVGDARTLVFKNCHPSISDKHVFAHYQSLGEDAVVNIQWRNNTEGKFDGTGYITFCDKEMAAKALSLKKPIVHGQKVKVLLRSDTNAEPAGKKPQEAEPPKPKKKRKGPQRDIDKAEELLQEREKKREEGETLLNPRVQHWPPHILEKAMKFEKVFESCIHALEREPEEVAAYREEHHMEVLGQVEVPPVLGFDEVDFGEKANALLRQEFERPTPIQTQAWPILLRGKDCIGLAETGSGKTLAFSLPGLVHVDKQERAGKGGPIMLVLSPTRELALQISREVSKFAVPMGIRVDVAFGGGRSGHDGKGSRKHQAKRLIKGMEVLVATPLRLIDFIEAKVVTLERVTYAVLDEADRMLSMGFKDQIKSIMKLVRPDRHLAMFSATFGRKVQDISLDLFGKKAPFKLTISKKQWRSANKNVEQRVIVLESDLKRMDTFVDIIRQIKEEHPESSRTIVFVNERMQVESAVAECRLKFPNAPFVPLHGDINQRQREAAMRTLRSDPHAVLITTDVMARGIDVKDLVAVVNAFFPTTITQYIHRIGRTGRAGSKGVAYSLLLPRDDENFIPPLVEIMEEAEQEIPETLKQALEKMDSNN